MSFNPKTIYIAQRTIDGLSWEESYVSGSNLILQTDSTGSVVGLQTLPIGYSVISSSYATTASYASNAGSTIPTGGFVVTASGAMSNLTASYALTASYVLSGGTTTPTGGFVVTSSGALSNQTASYSITSYSASYSVTSSFSRSSLTSSYSQTSGTSSYVSFNNIDGKPSLVSSSAQVINLLPTGVISSSAQVINNLPANTVSSSIQLSNGGGAAFTSSNNVTFGSVTASVAFIGALTGTSSWASNARTASYVTYDNVANKPTLISGSAQIKDNLPGGTVSGSAQTVSNLSGQNVSVSELTASIIKVTTLIVETVSASVVYSTGSNRFGSVDTNTQTFTGSVLMRGSLNVGSGVTSSFLGNLVGSASYAVSASYAPNSVDVSAFATTGSNTFRGTETISGSLNVIGSAVHLGSMTITGSLGISGSTTQVGNNTLFGNTILSGSITISGSGGSALPSIRIYGNSQIDGYMRFDPTTNATINTSVSASYIFSSGSTGDLYFSENADGVNNVVRLRWFEGNLYSGLLNGGIISQSSSTTYQVGSGSGIIVNLGASVVADPRPTIQYLKWSNLSSSIAAFSASSDNTYVAIQSGGTIYEQAIPFADGQYDTLIPIGLIIHNNHSTINAVKSRPSLGYGFKQRQTVFTQAFGPLKLSGMVLSVSGSSTGSLIVGSGTCFVDGGNYQTDPNNPSYITDTGTNTSKIFRYYQTGSEWIYNTNGGTGFGTVDPTQYSLNGTLTAVPGVGVNRQWSIQRVFWFPKTATGAIIVYYGNATYLTKTDAVANIPFESFNEAFNTAENAVYIGALVVRNNADFTDATSYAIQPGGLFRSVGGSGGGTSVTSPLSGLSDVAITAPSNGQPLVYNSSTVKWENSSILTASLYGSATTSVTASYVTYDNVANKPTLISGSAQIVNLLPGGTISSSAQVVNNLPTNTISSSAQLSNGGVAAFTSSNNVIFGRVTASFGFLGSLTGTASYATQALTASYALSATATLPANVVSSSAQLSNGGGTAFTSSNNVTFGSVTASIGFLGTASYATQALTASYALSATATMPANVVSSSAQLSNGGGTAFTSSNNVTFGSVTASIGFLGTASYATQALTASYAVNVNPSATASYATNALTASYVDYANVKNITIASQFAGTASFALNVDGGTF